MRSIPTVETRTQRKRAPGTERGSAAAVRELLEGLPHPPIPQMLDQRLDPLSELILTILSQHTSDRNSGPAFQRLRERFPTWEVVESAPVELVADAIRSAGLANIKAPRIQAVLRSVREQRGDLDLSFLATLEPADAVAWLSKLPGVGPKTAACVLLFSLGMPAMPVDTHIHRVLKRYGAVPERCSAGDAQAFVESVLLPDEMHQFHVAVIEHGRQTCKAIRPACDRCPVATGCRYRAQAAVLSQPEQPVTLSTLPQGVRSD